MGPFIITAIAVLVVVATSVALWWWRISAKIAPYEDELAKQKAGTQKPADEHVVVVGKRGPRPEQSGRVKDGGLTRLREFL